MFREHQILHHLSEGKSQRMIAGTLGVSRNTVASVLAVAKRSGQSYPELLRMDEQTLFQTLFPEKAAELVWVIPDYEKIHKELLRHGVTLRLLWEEYVDACREVKRKRQTMRCLYLKTPHLSGACNTPPAAPVPTA